MRLLATIMDPTSGKIWMIGEETRKNAREDQRKISYMSQKFGLYTDLTVRENMDFYAEIYGVRTRRKNNVLMNCLKFSNLAPFADRLADKLSAA